MVDVPGTEAEHEYRWPGRSDLRAEQNLSADDFQSGHGRRRKCRRATGPARQRRNGRFETCDRHDSRRRQQGRGTRTHRPTIGNSCDSCHRDGRARIENGSRSRSAHPPRRRDGDDRGAKTRYAGTMASYAIQVSNSGNATAETVRVTAVLPQGAKFIGASSGGQWKADQAAVVWTLPPLRPGAISALEMKCALTTPGPNRIQVATASSADVSDSANMITNVEALADLKLEVCDPAGPIGVGDEVVYELKVRNRGSKSAEGIGVIAYFSEGIDPVAASGGVHDIANGVVAFRPIAALAAGADASFKIRARRCTAASKFSEARSNAAPSAPSWSPLKKSRSTAPTTCQACRDRRRRSPAVRSPQLRKAPTPPPRQPFVNRPGRPSRATRFHNKLNSPEFRCPSARGVGTLGEFRFLGRVPARLEALESRTGREIPGERAATWEKTRRRICIPPLPTVNCDTRVRPRSRTCRRPYILEPTK